MKLITVVAITILSLATPASPQQIPVWYDTLYDQADTPLSSVACSGVLINDSYNTFGDLPGYPLIGGAPQIDSWDSPSCGSCWQFIYSGPNNEIKSFFFTVINTGGQGGYTISLEGMNLLTYGDALTLDGVLVDVSSETSYLCGL